MKMNSTFAFPAT